MLKSQPVFSYEREMRCSVMWVFEVILIHPAGVNLPSSDRELMRFLVFSIKGIYYLSELKAAFLTLKSSTDLFFFFLNLHKGGLSSIFDLMIIGVCSRFCHL